jgi:transposase-like protein
MRHRRKISPEKVLEAVKKYFNDEGSKATIADEYGISISFFRSCIARYREQGELAFIEILRNKVYSEETRKHAIEAYLNGEGSFIDIAAKYGLRSKTTLQKWVKVYNSGKGFRHNMSGGSRMKEARSATEEERIQIAKDCISNGGNYGETALKYKVSYQQVYQWTKKFKEMGAAGLEDRRGKRKKDQTPRTELEKAQIEIERLKHELYMTQMERDLLKKLDEIERREAYRK